MSSFKRKIEEQKLFEEAKGKVRLGLCCINNTLRNPVKQIGQKRKPEPIFNSRTTNRKCFNVDYAKELALQNIKDIIPILHQISKCIDESIENNVDEDKISDVVELMKGIADDNWTYIRN